MQDAQIVKGRIKSINKTIETPYGDLPAVLLKNLSTDQKKIFGVYEIQDEISYDKRTHVSTETVTEFDKLNDKIAKTSTVTKKSVSNLRLEVLDTSIEGEESGVIWTATEKYRKSSFVVTIPSGTYIVGHNEGSTIELLANYALVLGIEFPKDENGNDLDHYPQQVLNISDPANPVQNILELEASDITMMKVNYNTFQSGIDTAFGDFESAIGTTAFNDIWPLVDAYDNTLPENGDKYLESLNSEE